MGRLREGRGWRGRVDAEMGDLEWRFSGAMAFWHRK